MADYLGIISEAVQNGDDEKAVQTVEEALRSGISAADILDKGLIPGIQALGERFKSGEAYLPEILISGRAMTQGVEVLKPYFSTEDEMQKQGIVVITIDNRNR